MTDRARRVARIIAVLSFAVPIGAADIAGGGYGLYGLLMGTSNNGDFVLKWAA